MSFAEMKNEVLRVLADNIHNNANPGAVDSDSIARKLEINHSEVIAVLKSMNEMGVIICDVENRYCVITREGLNYVSEYQQAQQKW